MEKKSEYLIWRSKNGFFSAVNKEGILFTWSMVTGNLLYSRNANEFKIDIKHYTPFQANESDSLYYADFYSL